MNIKDFWATKPTLLARIDGCSLYEHPKYGDEAPIVVVLPSGVGIFDTGLYDVPSEEEFESWSTWWCNEGGRRE